MSAWPGSPPGGPGITPVLTERSVKWLREEIRAQRQAVDDAELALDGASAGYLAAMRSRDPAWRAAWGNYHSAMLAAQRAHENARDAISGLLALPPPRR